MRVGGGFFYRRLPVIGPSLLGFGLKRLLPPNIASEHSGWCSLPNFASIALPLKVAYFLPSSYAEEKAHPHTITDPMTVG